MKNKQKEWNSATKPLRLFYAFLTLFLSHPSDSIVWDRWDQNKIDLWNLQIPYSQIANH
jgi:hypothetical protein